MLRPLLPVAVLLTACGVAVDSAGTTPCYATEGEVVGIVVRGDVTGPTEAGARVDATDGGTSRDATTDTDGEFGLSLPAGNWSFTATSADGTCTSGVPVEVDVAACGLYAIELIVDQCAR